MNASFRNSTTAVPKHRREREPFEPFASGTCTVPGCKTKIPIDRIMCASHWEQVPQALGERVISQFRLAQNGYPGAADTYRRACLKAVDALTKKTENAAPVFSPAEILSAAKTCAFTVLDLSDAATAPIACEIVFLGFYHTLQTYKIAPARLGISLKKWRDAELRDVKILRAEIEAYTL